MLEKQDEAEEEELSTTPLVSEPAEGQLLKLSRALVELEEGEMEGTTSQLLHISTWEIWSHGWAVKNDSEADRGFSHF